MAAKRQKEEKVEEGVAFDVVLPSDLIRHIAKFIPAYQRYNTLRRVSGPLRRALPPEPSPPLVFHISVAIMQHYHDSSASIYSLCHASMANMLSTLQDIQSGKTMIPVKIIPGQEQCVAYGRILLFQFCGSRYIQEPIRLIHSDPGYVHCKRQFKSYADYPVDASWIIGRLWTILEMNDIAK
jgi:hypothetical protein